MLTRAVFVCAAASVWIVSRKRKAAAMTSRRECRSVFITKARPTVLAALLSLSVAGALPAQKSGKEPLVPGKPTGDQAAWQKRLDELAGRTQQEHKTPLPQAPPSPPSTTPPPAAAPVSPSNASGQDALALFEDDFDRAGVVSFAQRRVVLLVFAPQSATDAWRNAPELQSWAQRAVICPVHAEALGDRAQRLAKAFGVDPAGGGLLTALVRAPDGVKEVTGDQLLYQVLGRYPAPRDASDVLNPLQEGVRAYELKKTQYVWDATLSGVAVPSASQPTSPAAAPTATPSPIKESKPVEAPKSPFETVVMSAWKSRKPIMLLFPGSEPFDKTKCAEAWSAIPSALAPEHLVLTPGSSDGSIGGKPVNWEEFFDVGGRYPHAVMILPENPDGGITPGVADMSYRVIARRHGALFAETAAHLARQWMSEDFDAVTMRAWVLHRPMLLVFPHPERERELLDSPVLAKLEERAAVFVNTKAAVSGIRKKTAAQLEKEFATPDVERSELVLVKLETKGKDATAVRLDEVTLSPVNRAFGKKSPDKILDWIQSRVPAKKPESKG